MCECEIEMKGVGGPLLCIGDLLSDLGEKEEDGVKASDHHQAYKEVASPSSASVLDSNNTLQSSLDLTKLFQENYSQLNEAFAGKDNSWTGLTLKLCTALETASELVQLTNSNVGMLSEKVGELEKIVKRGDSAVAAAKAVHVALNQKGGPFSGSQNVQ
ncbi:hypothetical protein JCGZ_12066 [Jatropha curcas]|uniref:Uncharacterized protein n=1 Tax=Jatropha curcas TaxID=180498 RepID=A0A067KLV8_JATCU|nr:uncharacterized protein LOC105638907 [Jatropha curcas]KDP32774.1 hypothetical protein JCGZ_12066 [Jatropha curcas]